MDAEKSKNGERAFRTAFNKSTCLELLRLHTLLQHAHYRNHKGGGCTPCEQIERLMP
jgi:hypothetical protein